VFDGIPCLYFGYMVFFWLMPTVLTWPTYSALKPTSVLFHSQDLKIWEPGILDSGNNSFTRCTQPVSKAICAPTTTISYHKFWCIISATVGTWSFPEMSAWLKKLGIYFCTVVTVNDVLSTTWKSAKATGPLQS